MEDLRFYVYAHQRKDNGECFHIGKGTGKRYKSKQHRNRHWHFVANKYGFTPVILVSGLSEEKAFELETSFIEQIGVENLTNLAEPKYNGNFAHSKESKRTIGEKNRRPKPEGFGETMTKVQLGKSKDFSKSPNRSIKLSKAMKGRKNTWTKGKPVLQFDLQGNFIKEWNNATEASKILNINKSQISAVARGNTKYKTAGGFIWKIVETKSI